VGVGKMDVVAGILPNCPEVITPYDISSLSTSET